MVSVCLPSDALSQRLPSSLGFSYLEHGISLHDCSNIAAVPDLGHGVYPLCRLLLLCLPTTASCSCTAVHILEAAEKKSRTKQTNKPKPWWLKQQSFRLWSCVLCLEICINQPVLTQMSVVNWRISWKPDDLGRLSSRSCDWPAVGWGALLLLHVAFHTLAGWLRHMVRWLNGSKSSRECKSQCRYAFQVSASSQLLWSLGQS